MSDPEIWCWYCLGGDRGSFPMFHPETIARTIYEGTALCFEHARSVRELRASA